jgi:phosphatidylglycerophosphate synthase
MSDVSASAVARHIRDHRSVTAAAERRLLIAIAQRLPRFINSDHLSALGLAAIMATGALFALIDVAPWAAYAIPLALALNWFGDSLDGTLARVRNRQRPRYGYYVDHVIDIFGALFMLCGLALSGYMNPFLAIGVLVAYLMVSAEVFLATHARGIFRMASFGFGPTELRIVLAIGALSLVRDPHVSLGALGSYRLFDVGGVMAIAGMAAALVVSAVRNARALYLAETVR